MNTPVNFSFVLTPEEIEQALIVSGKSVFKPKKSLVQSIILFALFALFLYYFIVSKSYQYCLLALVCLVFTALVWILPKQTLKTHAKTAADGKTVETTIYCDKIEVKTQYNDWKMELDEYRKIFETETVFVAIAENNKLLCIPKRAVPEEKMDNVRKMLFEFEENKDTE